MKTYIVLGHRGKYEDFDKDVLYVGNDEEKAFNRNSDEVYDTFSVELWFDEIQVKGWYGDSDQWEVDVDKIAELERNIEYSKTKTQEYEKQLEELKKISQEVFY